MKSFSAFALICLVIAGCQQKAREHHGDLENSPNQALYEEVMVIHDEVMPKMDDIYKTKTALKKRLETPGLSEMQKKEINDKIAQLDSADESMMVWMRKFDPIPDSLGEEKAREYLEQELVKVKKVRENILQALKNARQAD